MRFAIVSDICSNWAALNACLGDIYLNGIDQIVSLGNIIGPGPSPIEVIAAANDHFNLSLAGEYEAAVLGQVKTISKEITDALDWTRNKLSRKGLFSWLRPKNESLDYLRGLPKFSDSSQGIVYTFGDPYPAGIPSDAWGSEFSGDKVALLYPSSPSSPNSPSNVQLVGIVNKTSTAVIFVGNTNFPFLKLNAQSVSPEMFCPDSGEKTYDLKGVCIVGVGSVGLPRDGNWNTGYAIYDSGEKTVTFRRIPYDVGAAARRLQHIHQPWADNIACKLWHGVHRE